MDVEERAACQALNKLKCSCGGLRILTGAVQYTDPIRYMWRCNKCPATGTVGYDTLNPLKRKVVIQANL